MSGKGYDGSSIKVLKGIEAVRKRPGMYIGGTGPGGLHHLVYEVLDNSVDEAMAGHADKIVVRLLEDGSVEVADNGRGIPVDIHPEMGVPSVEVVMTTLHAGGKFDEGAYKTAGGLHGVGAAVVNALSCWTEVTVDRDGQRYHVRFERGPATVPTHVLGPTPKGERKTGTTVRFLPDPEIFKEGTDLDLDEVRNRVKERAYLNAGLDLALEDLRVEEPVREHYRFDGGTADFVADLVGERTTAHDDIVRITGQDGGVEVECALQYVGADREEVRAYANNISTIEGGTHLTGFRNAVTRTLTNFIENSRQVNAKTKKLDIKGDDTREGLVAVLSVRIVDPQFEGQTKAKLNNSEAQGAVQRVVADAFGAWLEENPAEAKAIVERVASAARAREAAERARKSARKHSELERGVLPGKLSDCSYYNPAANELFIVEGDSAGGSARMGRDRKFQAVLPLRGKVLNTWDKTPGEALKSAEIDALAQAIGAGVGRAYNVDNLRYHKIIVLADADVDGSHIRCLVLTALWRLFRPLIDGGYVYVAQPPLYRVSKGAKRVYCHTEEDREAAIRQLGSSASVARFKGLGEMRPEELEETTLEPDTRMLFQVTIRDAEEAEKLFEELMGGDAAPRRAYIVENAEMAEVDV